MRTSARNQFSGKIASVTRGAVNDEVVIKTDGGQEIVAMITHTSAERLALSAGKAAFALIKSSSIILATELGDGHLSVRNRLDGKIEALNKGAVNTEVVVALPSGDSLAAIITNCSAEALKLAVDAPVTALFKASSVIVGVAG
ncbi:MAG: TOBE domain-containing protein [Burkholderiales bacterium]|jgi:molybdate transport system regulatory protein|nr:TOBE domain-containing protein [Burkholderiales bacterium]